ncbi:tetratricopeptide repeat protein [bacterium]|nr:tetratricopeptide repeat protein [bacterium]
MKKSLLLFISLLVLAQPIYAQQVYDDNSVENPYYTQGNKYLNNSQFTSAIGEYKKALRENPNDFSSVIGLSNAYNSRAVYYNNTAKNPTKAANDLRSAIFYMKYFSSDSQASTQNSVAKMEENLKSLLSATNYSNAPENIYNTAKKLRTEGEFAASGYEWYKLLKDNKYRYEANVNLGDIFNILAKPQNAVGFYETANNIKPNNPDLSIKLARVYDQTGNIEKATTQYNSALASSTGETDDILNSLERIWQKRVMQNPKDAEAHANLGVIYQKQKLYNEALAEYQKAESLNNRNVNTRLNIGTLYQEQKNYDMAINVYNSILQVYPNNTQALTYKAQCLKALGRNEEAIKTYQNVLGYEPANKVVRAELFEILKATMPTENVLQYLYQSVQAQPMDATTYYDFAYELHKANKINDAITYYNQTLKMTSEIPDCYVNLSQAYRQKQDLVSARKVIEDGLKKYPNNDMMKKQLATIDQETLSSHLNNAAKAIEKADYEKAIEFYSKINPPTVDSLIGIASSYQELGNSQKALDYFKQALKLDPKNADLQYYVGTLYYNMNDYNSAKPYLTNAIKLNSPQSEDAKKLVAYIDSVSAVGKLDSAYNLYNEGKYPEAVALLNEIIKAVPDNATAYYYRGLVYDAQTKYAQAIKDYESALKYSPDFTLSYYSIAVDYDNLQKWAEAKSNYQKFVDSTKETNEYTDYAKKRLSEINI